MSILIRPGLRLLLEQYIFDKTSGSLRWYASLALEGHIATKNGFENASAAYHWAVDQVARFDSFVVA